MADEQEPEELDNGELEDADVEPPEGLLAWNEELARNVELFGAVQPKGAARFDTLTNILMTVAQWYVRKDGKYYDVEEPGPVFSRNDIERIIIQRLKGTYPDTKLSEDEIRQLLQVLIRDIFVDPRVSIPIWSGLRQSQPGNPNRLSFKRMAATINTWRKPAYRQLANVPADWGPVKSYLDTTFTRASERELLVNWLAWCLQNEADKPGWAPFLYSSEKGSGKSTFAKIAALLFGEENSATENNINKLVSRFNAPILEKKLVICEELNLPPGSEKANAVKTFITERHAVAEHKFQSVQQVEQVCCFIFITNHKPVWIEQGDRRFYVVHVDHDGHRLGPNGKQYAEQIGALMRHYEDPKAVATLYRAFMNHSIPSEFDPHSLDVLEVATEVMKELQESALDISRKEVEEYLNAERCVGVTLEGLQHMVTRRLSSKPSALKHVLADLGWVSRNAKWGGKDYARLIWLRPGYSLKGGRIQGPDQWETDTDPSPEILRVSETVGRPGHFVRDNLFKEVEQDAQDIDDLVF